MQKAPEAHLNPRNETFFSELLSRLEDTDPRRYQPHNSVQHRKGGPGPEIGIVFEVASIMRERQFDYDERTRRQHTNRYLHLASVTKNRQSVMKFHDQETNSSDNHHAKENNDCNIVELTK